MEDFGVCMDILVAHKAIDFPITYTFHLLFPLPLRRKEKKKKERKDEHTQITIVVA
jgi:hypothetical protein